LDAATLTFRKCCAQAGRLLGAVGQELEAAFGGPQDVEGVFVGRDFADALLYIVQTRPQP
jgi:hypothetical protein